MSPAHTPGPWRWEINAYAKQLHLVGGQPRKYDLTVMDFARWGMSRSTILLRDPSVGGMNLLHKLHERPDWIAPIPGREHHAEWCATVEHPDARLIAAAPELLEALEVALRDMESTRAHFAMHAPNTGVLAISIGLARAAIAKATGGHP